MAIPEIVKLPTAKQGESQPYSLARQVSAIVGAIRAGIVQVPEGQPAGLNDWAVGQGAELRGGRWIFSDGSSLPLDLA